MTRRLNQISFQRVPHRCSKRVGEKVALLQVVLCCLLVSYVFIVVEVHFTYEVQFHRE